MLSSINKCSQNNFYHPAWTSFRPCPYFSIHLFKEAVEGAIYHKLCCFIVSVHNTRIVLFQIMFHVLCFIISNDWKLNTKSKLCCASRQAGDFIFNQISRSCFCFLWKFQMISFVLITLLNSHFPYTKPFTKTVSSNSKFRPFLTLTASRCLFCHLFSSSRIDP